VEERFTELLGQCSPEEESFLNFIHVKFKEGAKHYGVHQNARTNIVSADLALTSIISRDDTAYTVEIKAKGRAQHDIEPATLCAYQLNAAGQVFDRQKYTVDEIPAHIKRIRDVFAVQKPV
jgi:hypothetical protein